jgi:hypothetical protein
MIFSDIVRTTILGGILMGIFLSFTPVEARLAPYDGIGGNGGAPFRLDCGEYGILVGLNGQSGAVVDQVTGLCVKIDPVSGIWVGGVYETNPAGGTGGGRFHKICPVGQALTGIQGNSTRFQGIEVVSSLEIDCTKLKITDNAQFPEIKGWREIGLQGDEDALKSPEFQDLCYTPAKATGHFERAWSQIGIALEGRAGIFVDHIHLVCGSLPKDKNGYRAQFKTSSKGSVPEGTPFKISWRAYGSKPELTSNLQYKWELHDVTPAAPGGPLTRRTDVRSPCSYAQPPCATSWFDSSSGSQIIFQSLPPAKYELRLKVRPTVPSTVESEARVDFEIRANQLAAVTVDPSTIQPAGTSTATITLEGPAPPGGKKVYLSSSNAQLIPVPETLMIPGGSTSTSLKLRTTSNLQIGQAIIRASIKKPLKMAVSKFSGMNVLGRGIPEPDESQMIENQEMSEVAGITPEAGESSAPSLSNNAQQEEQLESDVLAPEGNITQDQEITERGISSFRLGGSSKLDSKILSTKPNQGALGTFPDVTNVPSPPSEVPIPYPNVSGSNVAQPNSKKIKEATKLDNSLLTKPGPSDTAPQALSKVGEIVKSQKSLITKPGEAKEAVITVQSSLFERKSLAVPKVPPLQK